MQKTSTLDTEKILSLIRGYRTTPHLLIEE